MSKRKNFSILWISILVCGLCNRIVASGKPSHLWNFGSPEGLDLPPGFDLPSTVNPCDAVYLRLFHGSYGKMSSYGLNSNATELVDDPKYNMNKPIAIFIHGYTESLTRGSPKPVIPALLSTNSYNVILFDWSLVSDVFYVYPLLVSEQVAKCACEVLAKWEESGRFKQYEVYLIGHSLGAQLTGTVSNCMPKDRRPARITATDPAGPGFVVGITQHLNSRSAALVDIIHTDAGLYGVRCPLGIIDFYVNGGHRHQPGCSTGNVIDDAIEFCSHERSIDLYAASFYKSTKPFYAIPCSARSDNAGSSCTAETCTIMGYNISVPDKFSNGKQIYCLSASGEYPYSEGAAGVLNVQKPQLVGC